MAATSRAIGRGGGRGLVVAINWKQKYFDISAALASESAEVERLAESLSRATAICVELCRHVRALKEENERMARRLKRNKTSSRQKSGTHK